MKCCQPNNIRFKTWMNLNTVYKKRWEYKISSSIFEALYLNTYQVAFYIKEMDLEANNK